jgi:hypothetical protein
MYNICLLSAVGDLKFSLVPFDGHVALAHFSSRDTEFPSLRSIAAAATYVKSPWANFSSI